MVFELLKSQAERQLTARQIAGRIFMDYPVCCRAREKACSYFHTDNEVITLFAAEIGAYRPARQKKHPQVKTTAGCPKKILLHRQNG